MSFEKIISIPGMGGLFKMVAQMRNGGFVVEGLDGGKRIPISATQRIVMLKDISVFTMEDDIPLEDVFKKMKEQDDLSSSVTAKADPEELKATLKKVLPEFDEERVHVSDIRKMFSWYGMLKDIIGQASPESAENSVTTASEISDVAVAETPVKKVAAKKAPAKKKAAEETDEAAPKKTARKSTKSVE
jgi:hypothetical protein